MIDSTNPRSPGMLALAIVTIVVGCLYLLMLGCGGASLALMPLMKSLPGAGEGADLTLRMMDDSVVFTNMVAGFAIPTILYVTVLVAGVGMLKLKRWSRTLGLVFAGVSLAWAAISTPINLFVVQPRVHEMTAGMPGAALSQTPIMQYGSVLFGVVLYNALAVALLIILTRPSVKEQLVN